MRDYRKIFTALLSLILILFPISTYAAPAAPTVSYYGAGNYSSTAPVKPTTGLKFHVGYNAINTYGSVFTAAFDWNKNYSYCDVHISTISQWPATKRPEYFLIKAHELEPYIQGSTYYYNLQGALLNDLMQYPMDHPTIYHCSIKINKDRSEFNIKGVFSTKFLKKVIRHEVGHVLLLKHPSTPYVASVMHQNPPSDYTQYSDVVTSTDIGNIEYLWYDK